ncbi:MAG: replication and repair protein RecF [Verrucomicrobiaceae bacterium]|nr:replication and repair protein RecF [Verrucomicrobiaceae bacterium]
MLERIETRDFRCFTQASVNLHPDTTLLVGRNAQGKTSLLEAVCVLMRLQSPRTAKRTDLIRFGATTCLVEGRWAGHTLRCGMSATSRRLALDGAVCGRSADYLANSAVIVWMDHGDMNLVRGSGDHRRRFMDFAASQIAPEYQHALQGYARALRSRNHTLKRDSQVNWRQADAYARIMDGFHRTLTHHRRRLLHSMEGPAHGVLAMLSMGQEALELRYIPGCAEESLLEVLQASRAEEERTRTTSAGAHRDDFAAFLNGRAADSFASEGQQRSISLSLKLAQAQALEHARGLPPLLLIDDVFGELDPLRRRALLDGLPAGTQKIITTTHLDWAGDLGGRMEVFNVEAAALSRVQ